MRWLIVEDALRDRKGHWLEYVSTFVQELRALGDEVVVLCDRKAQRFVMEQTGARPVLPESIWHRMGDGAWALKRYLRVPGHAAATFFAMRKVFRGFNHQNTRKDTKGDERGAGSREQGERSFEPLITQIDTDNGREAGPCLDKPCGAAFSNPFTSKLARDSENISLTRSASGPALAAEPQDENVEKRKAKCGNLPATSYPLPATSSPPDWIFVPTVLVHHLLGWWLLLRAGSVPEDSRVLLFFPNLPIRLDDERKPHWSGGPTTKLMSWLFKNLRGEVESGKVVLGVETHAMRRALEGLIGMQVVYLPHPVPVKPGQWDARSKGRESSDGAGFPAETQRRGDFLTTLERQVGCENRKLAKAEERATESCPQRGAGSGTMQVNEQPKVGPTGEGVGTSESNELGFQKTQQGDARGTFAGAAFPSPFTSELARDSENASLIRFADASPLATSAKPIIFGCYGAARWEKGSDIFQEAIRLILSNEVSSGGCQVSSGSNQFAAALSEPATNYSQPATAAGRPLRFAIQWVEDFRDREGNLITVDPWLREHPQVEVIGRYFEGDEYEQRLAQTDVMVLPYRSPYRLRVSRVVIEAMLNGMPVIATRGTTLFDQAEEYGVVVGCEEGNAETLTEAMLEVPGRFEEMRASAEGKVNVAAASFSVGYFRDLLHSKMCLSSLSPS